MPQWPFRRIRARTIISFLLPITGVSGQAQIGTALGLTDAVLGYPTHNFDG